MMNSIQFIDLKRLNRILETRVNYCIPTTAEIILNYYGENKWTRDKIYKELIPKELNFQGFKRHFDLLLRNFNINIQSHNSNINQLVQFVKTNINEGNPIISAVKSDYAKSSGESGKYSTSKISFRGITINVILFTDNNAQSRDTHIVPIIGYSDQYIFIYEFNEGIIFGVDYMNNIFYQITQEGSFNTMTIKPKDI